MLNKVREYFENTYKDTKMAIDRKYDWGTPEFFVEGGISDCLSVAIFAQTIGCTFDEVNPIFEEYEEKLRKLLTN